jgi:ABC-type glucose/galactose transport system permease subunit
MASRYRILELADGLRITPKTDLTRGDRLGAAVIAAIIVGAVSNSFAGTFAFLATAPVAAVLVFKAIRATSTQPPVTKFEFLTEDT